jgi:tetratricopeptide (TPR) repeat protein
MPTNQEKVSQLLADSHFAFINSQNSESLHLANEAMRLAPKNPDAYQCAGDAYMSLGQYEKAVESYKKAVKLDQNNGNRYFNLGYALATNEKAAVAIKNLAKADELGCSPENTVQLYNLLGIICFDIGRYKDALVNLEKAEQIIGVDMDIMKRKVIIYGMKNDIRNGLLTTNQMKLVAPSDYTGYQLAFKLLCQANRLDAAERELEMAKKYAELSMDYYFDCMTFEIQKYQTDKDKQRYNKALTFIEEALKTLKPTSTEVIESYINAAEIYLQLEDPDKTIDCLNAAQNPAESYNLGFDVIDKEFEPVNLTEYDVEEMIEADKERIAEKYGDYGLEELAESIEPDENGAREYLTNVEDETDTEETAYKLDETEEIELTPENIDQINRLYIGAYTLKKEFNKVIDYARKLQSSESVQNSYIGIYSETNAYKELGSPETKQKYEETIKYFRNAMIKDSSDMAAVTFRIQCYMDIGQYEEAEQLCNLLANELRKPLLEKIEEARSVDS